MKPLYNYIVEAIHTQFRSLKSKTYEFKIKHSNWAGKIQIDSKKPDVTISRILGDEIHEFHIPTDDFIQILGKYADKINVSVSLQHNDCGIVYQPLPHTISVWDGANKNTFFEFSAYVLDDIIKDNKSSIKQVIDWSVKDGKIGDTWGH